jgi:CofD-related protein of GAK system
VSAEHARVSSPPTIRRLARLPDPLRVARSLDRPELGPRVLFFSGGTALRETSRALKRYTHNSVHLVPPFDSGGSSARLRQAFHMLSVGDLRNRLMALADETLRGNPEILALFSSRFPMEAQPRELRERLARMVAGSDELVAAVPEPLRRIVRTHLRQFAEQMPARFDLRGASVGNLVLAAGYLTHDRDIDSVLYLFSKLVEVRGLVRPIVDADLHLVAALADGTRVVGQHRLTGKQERPIGAPVSDVWLCESLGSPESLDSPEPREPTRVPVDEIARHCILEADVICYPMGSFYSSVIANLLPTGVGSAVRAADCPKVYVPNMGRDPEQLGMGIADAVETLLRFLRRDAGSDARAGALLNLVIVDSKRGDYPAATDGVRLKELGVELVDVELVTSESHPRIDPERLSEMLVSLA